MYAAITWRQVIFVTISALVLCAYLYYPQQENPPIKFRNLRQQNYKYILQWGDPNLSPFDFLGKGTSEFVKNDCEDTNCFVTNDRNYFKDLTEFDVVVFNGRELEKHLKEDDFPWNRTVKQKYVYVNMESSHNYPVCNKFYDGFFNWTWTYKLNSDSRLGYITVYNLTGGFVAPKVNMTWPKLDPVDDNIKDILKTKSKAAAWFVSNCRSRSKREVFAREVNDELRKYDHSLHIFGSCGKFICQRSRSKACFDMLAKDYYFYFAFENSFAEDYVTEKVTNALDNYAVPVVFGAADYNRFLPPGSYLRGRQLGAKRLAETMAAIIRNHQHGDGRLYHDFFRWRNHYTYKLTATNDDICRICRNLNDEELMSKVTVYDNFTTWWNSRYASCKVREKRRIDIESEISKNREMIIHDSR